MFVAKLGATDQLLQCLMNNIAVRFRETPNNQECDSSNDRSPLLSGFCCVSRLPAVAQPQLTAHRNDELLADLDLIGIVQSVLIGLEDPHVVVRISVELLCDLRE
jgi:hypothetical protein